MAQLARIAIERRSSEDALRQSEGRFRGLFDNVVEGVYQVTLDGYLLSELARLHRQCGRLEQASACLEEAWPALEVKLLPTEPPRALCERGHLLLASGRTAREALDEARARAASLGVASAPTVEQAVARLERAQQAFEAGLPLFRGQLVEDLPDGLRRHLRAEGQPV